MAVTRLPLPTGVRARRAVELADLRAAFTRISRRRWNVEPPVMVLGIRRGLVALRTSSAPWRTELLWSAEELCDALTQELPSLPRPRGMTVRLGAVSS